MLCMTSSFRTSCLEMRAKSRTFTASVSPFAFRPSLTLGKVDRRMVERERVRKMQAHSLRREALNWVFAQLGEGQRRLPDKEPEPEGTPPVIQAAKSVNDLTTRERRHHSSNTSETDRRKKDEACGQQGMETGFRGAANMRRGLRVKTVAAAAAGVKRCKDTPSKGALA